MQKSVLKKNKILCKMSNNIAETIQISNNKLNGKMAFILASIKLELIRFLKIG